ncbi:MAG: hypothetical protein GY943_25635, partial [Chloroflexi bacterium]|nr:hypothetical protein [Chloroflexota bacterium]
AGVYLMLDDTDSAQTCLDAVLSSQTPMDALGKRYCWTRRAELALKQNEPTLALNITERLINSTPGISPGCVISFLWKLKAEALATIGQTEDACTLLNEAIKNAQAANERYLLWRIHASLGQLHHMMGHLTTAECEYATARSLIDEMANAIADAGLQERFRQGAYSKLSIFLNGEW